MKCPTCGSALSDQMPYCEHCGIIVSQPGEGVIPAQGSLLAIEGPMKGESVALIEAEIMIGRSSGCDIRTGDRTFSRRHARIRLAEGAWYLQVLGESIDIVVNDVPVRATRLNPGDRIRIGQTTWVFQAGTMMEKAAKEGKRFRFTQNKAWIYVILGVVILILVALLIWVVIRYWPQIQGMIDSLLGNLRSIRS